MWIQDGENKLIDKAIFFIKPLLLPLSYSINSKTNTLTNMQKNAPQHQFKLVSYL